MKNFIYIISLCTLFFSCKSNKLATSGSFKDDVSIYRLKLTQEDTTSESNAVVEEIVKSDTLPYIPIYPEKDINYELSQASILLAQRNQKVIEERGILGYTIQVYSGNNRKIAEEIRDKLIITYEEPAKRVYDPPNYKVKIGEFLSKMEAYELFLIIKEDFPQAFIVPELLKTDMSRYILKDEK